MNRVVYLDQCVFWVIAFFIGILALWLIQRINVWLIVGRFRVRHCDRHIYCNEWKVSNCTWYVFTFFYLFVLGLLTGYKWWAGLLFLIVFVIAERYIAHCCPQYFEDKGSQCGVDFILGFLGYLLGLILRHTLCWFPPSSCNTYWIS